jgi:hypothetical protein
MNVAIAFVCKEDLSLSSKYTSRCKKNISFWSQRGRVFVLTNNVEAFEESDCVCLFDDSYYSTFDRFDILHELQKEWEIVVYLDCDEHFFVPCLDLGDLPPGMHAYGRWVDTWGNIKGLDYFEVWRNHISVADEVYFPWESVFILKSHALWEKTYEEILKYRAISRETQRRAAGMGVDLNPHHGVERCEAIGLYVACQTTGFPLHLESPYTFQFWDHRVIQPHDEAF